MTEIILTVVIIILSVLLGYFDNNNRKERKALLNALRAKDANELAQLTMADKTEIKVGKKKPEESDLIPSDQLSDEQFKEIIDKDLKEE